MKPPTSGRDPRRGILLGLALLVVAGLGIRALVGPGPWTGWRINRAMERARSGDPATARAELQALLEEHPGEPDAWYRAGRVLRETGHASESALYLTKATELDPTSSLFRYELAKSLTAAGLTDDARRAIGDLLTLDAEHADGLYLGAAIEASRGELVSALFLFGRAQAASPSDPDRYRWDPMFDPIRNEPAFLAIAYSWRIPGAFRVEEENGS